MLLYFQPIVVATFPHAVLSYLRKHHVTSAFSRFNGHPVVKGGGGVCEFKWAGLGLLFECPDGRGGMVGILSVPLG